jgi:predicted NAD-dependent protein-ADP-ribosyltransferase YbiA (DUF1768 family)
VRVIIKDSTLIFVAGDEDERSLVGEFLGLHDGHVFQLAKGHERAVVLSDLGPHAEACREPIDIGSRVANHEHRLISNFAETPFELDCRRYASVEGFWQSLRFPDAIDRARVGALAGVAAKRAGETKPWETTFDYDDTTIAVGRVEHWQLMERACEAKFLQNSRANRALLGTGSRPLRHRTRVDSRSIPGVVMADIWMRVRERIRLPSG